MLPLEINFVNDPSQGYLGLDIAKCFPIGVDSPNDMTCNDGTVPRQLNWSLRMIISLVQPENEFTGYVDFPAKIIDPCLSDEVSFTNTATTPLSYLLKFNPVVAEYAPNVVQKYALCPLQCTVYEPVSGLIPPFVSTFTTIPYYTSGANPSIETQTTVLEIVTANKALDYTYGLLNIKCVAPQSLIAERQDIT